MSIRISENTAINGRMDVLLSEFSTASDIVSSRIAEAIKYAEYQSEIGRPLEETMESFSEMEGGTTPSRYAAGKIVGPIVEMYRKEANQTHEDMGAYILAKRIHEAVFNNQDHFATMEVKREEIKQFLEDKRAEFSSKADRELAKISKRATNRIIQEARKSIGTEVHSAAQRFFEELAKQFASYGCGAIVGSRLVAPEYAEAIGTITSSGIVTCLFMAFYKGTQMPAFPAEGILEWGNFSGNDIERQIL